MISGLEANFQAAAEAIALFIEAIAIAIVAIGALEAAFKAGLNVLARNDSMTDQRETWLRFAAWILLALEFALGADVIRTAVAPSWEDIGKLGAIAAIRTALSYFLAKDVEEAARREGPAAD